MVDKLMYIPYDKTQNYPFCRLNVLVTNNQKINKSTQSLKIRVYKLLGTCPHTQKLINSGILRDKPMVDKLMYIPNDIKQNYPFYRLSVLDNNSLLTNNQKINKSTQSLYINE